MRQHMKNQTFPISSQFLIPNIVRPAQWYFYSFALVCLKTSETLLWSLKAELPQAAKDTFILFFPLHPNVPAHQAALQLTQGLPSHTLCHFISALCFASWVLIGNWLVLCHAMDQCLIRIGDYIFCFNFLL